MTEETAVIEENPAENVLHALQEAGVVEEPAETAVEATAEESETPAEQPKEVETQESEDKRKNPWFLKRISAEAEARRIAEQKASDLEAMVERLQKGQTEPPTTSVAPNSAEWQTAVQREAARMRLQDDSTAIRDAGFREYGHAFQQNLAILNAAGAVSDDIVMDLIAVDKDNAHKILATLAEDPERAASLAGMDSRRRVAELTRISDRMATKVETIAPKTAAPAAKQVSKAPAPPPAIEPSATKTKNWRADDATEEEFQRGWEARMKERGIGRR